VLSAEELQRLSEIDDDGERSEMLTELMETGETQKTDKVDAAFARWYLALPTDEHRGFVDLLSEEEITNLAGLPLPQRTQMLVILMRTKKGLDEKETADRLAAEVEGDARFARIENHLRNLRKALHGAAEMTTAQVAKFPQHREDAQQLMRHYAEDLRLQGELRRASPDKPRRFRHIFGALLWLVIVMGPIIIIGLLTR
jgi:hypothetical protein